MKKEKHQLEQLKRKEQKQLRHWHVSDSLPEYLPTDLQEAEHVQACFSLLGRRSRLKLGDVLPKIHHLGQKITGLEAELTFWRHFFEAS